MTGEIPSTAARRVRRPSWRDPRLGVGVLLVVGSVALGTWVLNDADRGTEFYAARTALMPGDAVAPEDLVVVEARLPGAEDAYLRAGEPVGDGAVITRPVGAGELVPVGAVGTGEDVDVRPVGVPVAGALSQAVVTGALVDLWLTPDPPTGIGAAVEPAEPRLVAPRLRVADVTTNEDLFAAGGSTTVEVLVPSADLPDVLAALAAEGTVTLVPVPGGA